MRLVQRDALAQVAVGVVDRALGQPGCQVEQLDGQRLAVGPLLARAARPRQRHPLHGEHGEPVVAVGLPRVVAGGVGEQQRGLRQLAALLEEVGDDAGVLLALARVAAQHVDDLAGVPVGGATHLADGAQQHDPGVRQPGDVVGQQPGEHVEHEPAPGGGGQRALPAPRALRVLLVREVLGPRLGHHPVRVEDARIGAQQVDVPGERRQLGQPGELGQRARRVEHRPAGAGPQRLVDDQPGEERLAGPQPADDGRQAGCPAHLLGQPRVPRDGPPGGGAGLADHDAAPVAHAGGGGGHGGGRPGDRAATPVGGGGQRLAGDELAGVAVLRLGVLDLHLRAGRRRAPAGRG